MATALGWQSLGAPSLHLVDLDGAQTGKILNLDTIREIASSVLIPTELGGGIRHLETIERILRVGVERVIISTAAVEDPNLVSEACRRYGDAVVVSIDARDGCLAIRGWLEQTELSAAEFVRAMSRIGVKRFNYTDINRDGTLTEPNFTAIFELVESTRLPIVAAGGISRLSHLKMLSRLGVSAAIVGKALYTGDIDLKQALAALDRDRG